MQHKLQVLIPDRLLMEIVVVLLALKFKLIKLKKNLIGLDAHSKATQLNLCACVQPLCPRVAWLHVLHI